MRVFEIKAIDLGEDSVKCGGCNWETNKLFVLADSKDEAIELVKGGLAGLCGDCFCEMLVERAIEIS